MIRPLFAAGFVTAFGAHSIAATLGVATPDLPTHLFTLGVLLALYDGAEVLLNLRGERPSPPKAEPAESPAWGTDSASPGIAVEASSEDCCTRRGWSSYPGTSRRAY